MKINEITEACGKIVQGVNTTTDVKVGQTEKEAKKFFGGNGKPKHLGVTGATPNQAFNMGLTESEDIEERKLTGGEKRSREANVKKLKPHKADFEKRYGKDAESVMYAVATKRAKNESEDTNEAFGSANSMWEPIKGIQRFINKFKDTDNYELANRIMKTVTKQNPDISLIRAARKVASQFHANNIELDPERIAHNWEVAQGKGTKKISDIANMTEGNEMTIDYHGELMCEYDDSLLEAEYQGRKVELNKPMQGDVKKFKVYVKNDKGNVVKVNFGEKGAKIKKNNPERRKSFRARHNCDNPGPKHKARYWSCKKW